MKRNEQPAKSSSKSLLNVTLVAPATGLIIARNAFPQQRFDRGAELFRIADLSRVWIVADLFGDDARHSVCAPPPSALPDRPQEKFLPRSPTRCRADAETRTHAQVRLEMANPGLALRPGMFVDIEFLVRLPRPPPYPRKPSPNPGSRKRSSW